MKLAKAQPGFLGLDGARNADGVGILVSYWRDEQSIAAWRELAAHAATRDEGRNRPWYEGFSVHIAKVERTYVRTRPDADT